MIGKSDDTSNHACQNTELLTRLKIKVESLEERRKEDTAQTKEDILELKTDIKEIKGLFQGISDRLVEVSKTVALLIDRDEKRSEEAGDTFGRIRSLDTFLANMEEKLTDKLEDIGETNVKLHAQIIDLKHSFEKESIKSEAHNKATDERLAKLESIMCEHQAMLSNHNSRLGTVEVKVSEYDATANDTQTLNTKISIFDANYKLIAWLVTAAIAISGIVVTYLVSK